MELFFTVIVIMNLLCCFFSFLICPVELIVIVMSLLFGPFGTVCACILSLDPDVKNKIKDLDSKKFSSDSDNEHTDLF